MHGSFIRLAANQGAGSSARQSYSLRATSSSEEEECNVVMIPSISVSSMGGGRCNAASSLNTVIWAGRQLLYLPDSLVHARMLTSPDTVRTCVLREAYY